MCSSACKPWLGIEAPDAKPLGESAHVGGMTGVMRLLRLRRKQCASLLRESALNKYDRLHYPRWTPSELIVLD